MPSPKIQMLIDALRQGTFSPDPSMTAQGQQLPPQAVLDQPIPQPMQQEGMPGAMPVAGQGSPVVADPLNKAASLRALIEQRMMEQQAAGNYQ